MTFRKILLGLFAASILTLICIVALFYFHVIPAPGPLIGLFVDSQELEFSASFHPSRTLVYASVNLLPAQDQLEYSRDIWETLNTATTFPTFWEDLNRELKKSADLDFDEDIASWVGPEISAALIDFDSIGEEYTFAFSAGVRDRRAASRFLQKWLTHAENSDSSFTSDLYRGFRLHVNDGQTQAFALSQKLFLVGSNQAALREMIDLFQDDGASLARTTRFQEARTALPEERFASVFVNVLDLFDALDESGPVGINQAQISLFDLHWAVSSATLEDRAIRFRTITPSSSTNEFSLPALNVPLHIIPVESVGFFSAAFDPNVDNWRESFSQYPLNTLVLPDAITNFNDAIAEIAPVVGLNDLPPLKAEEGADQIIDLALLAAHQLTDVDFEADFFDHLSGQLSLVIRGTQLSGPILPPGSTDDPLQAAIFIPHRAGSFPALDATLAKLTQLAASQSGIQPSTMDLGADHPAKIYNLGISYAPGYLFHQGRLFLSSAQSSLEDLVALHQDSNGSLAEDPEYHRARAFLEPNLRYVVYLNMELLPDHLMTWGPDYPNTDYLREAMRILVIGGDDYEGPRGVRYQRNTAVLTLFPQP